MAEQAGNLDRTSSLLERHHQGDRSALDAILGRDLEWVRDFVHRHLKGPVRRLAETGDVVQAVMLAVLEHGQRFVVQDRDSFRPLLATMVLNEIRSQGRRLAAGKRDIRREKQLGTDSVLYLGNDLPTKPVSRPDLKAADGEELAFVRLAIEIVDPDVREVYELRTAKELSFREIGEQLECEEEAARKRFKSAVLRIGDAVKKLKAGRLRDLFGE